MLSVAMAGPSQEYTSADCLFAKSIFQIQALVIKKIASSVETPSIYIPVLAAAGIRMTRVPRSFGVEISLKN